MNLEQRFPWFLWAVSALIWRWPGRASVKMAEFSQTEAGSSLDMLRAAELAPQAALRRKFFRHCLDEHRHARMFAERALALSGRRGRASAVLDDANYIPMHGLRGPRALYETLGELDFLAFVWLHELRGAQQFEVYARLMADDPESARMFESIGRDERFHIRYSLNELEQRRSRGERWRVLAAILRVRLRRVTDAWLRVANRVGHVMATAWLSLFYFAVLSPFGLLLARRERIPSGFCELSAEPPAPLRARSQA